jgi:hypothetical protein
MQVETLGGEKRRQENGKKRREMRHEGGSEERKNYEKEVWVENDDTQIMRRWFGLRMTRKL